MLPSTVALTKTLTLPNMDHYILLAAFIVTGISLIILPYLYHHFWKLRHHFLIAPRFPKTTIIVSLLMFIASIEALMVMYILDKYDHDRTKAASTIYYPAFIVSANIFVFTFCAFIMFRALIFHEKWRTAQNTLTEQVSIISPKNTTHASKGNSCCCNSISMGYINKPLLGNVAILLSVLLVVFSISSISIPYPHFTTLRVIYKIPWTAFVILSIFILVKSRKTKESLLCFRETYSISAMIVLQLIVQQFRNLIDLHIRFFISYIIGMFIIHTETVVSVL